MNDDQVERLLSELASTRKSFDQANDVFVKTISSIRWTRINTAILYCLMVAVFIVGVLGAVNYINDRREACERSNSLRVTVAAGMEQNALAIGTALAIVFHAPEERLNQYLDAYKDQKASDPILQLKEC